MKDEVVVHWKKKKRKMEEKRKVGHELWVWWDKCCCVIEIHQTTPAP